MKSSLKSLNLAAASEFHQETLFIPQNVGQLQEFFALNSAFIFYIEEGVLIESMGDADGHECAINLWGPAARPYSSTLVKGPHSHLSFVGSVKIRVIKLDSREAFGRSLSYIAAVEHMMESIHMRNYILGQKNTLKKYECLVRKYPEFLTLVPQYVLASFLTIAPQSLSRIRRKRVTKAVY